MTQVNDEVITTETASPLLSVDDVYVELFVPTLPPFTLHWYVGVPPLTGVAVKVTDVPEHIEVDGSAVMDTEGVTFALTITFNAAEAGVEVHPAVAAKVSVAVPVYAAGGVHVAAAVVVFGRNVPPTPPSSHRTAVVPLSMAPPRLAVVPP